MTGSGAWADPRPLMYGRLVLAGTLATLLAVAANVVVSIVLRSVVDPSGVFQPLNVARSPS